MTNFVDDKGVHAMLADCECGDDDQTKPTGKTFGPSWIPTTPADAEYVAGLMFEIQMQRQDIENRVDAIVAAAKAQLSNLASQEHRLQKYFGGAIEQIVLAEQKKTKTKFLPTKWGRIGITRRAMNIKAVSTRDEVMQVLAGAFPHAIESKNQFRPSLLTEDEVNALLVLGPEAETMYGLKVTPPREEMILRIPKAGEDDESA